MAGYIAIKLSLHDCTVKKLMEKLEDMLSTVRDNVREKYISLLFSA